MRVRVEIEVPKGGFVKRRANGTVDYVSPMPCPFNYGCVPGSTAGDGDPLDAVVLGPALCAGTLVDVDILAVFRFVDAGDEDNKLVCGTPPLQEADRRMVATFFARYARAKTLLNLVRGRRGPTRADGWGSLADVESSAWLPLNQGRT